MEFNSCEKLFISEGFLFLGALVACIMALKRGDSDSFGVSQASYADTVAGIWGGVLKSPEWFRNELDLAFAALFPSGSTARTGCTGCSAAFPLPRLLALPALVESAHELTPFFPEAVPAWEWPRARLLLPSAAAIRWPSCGSGPDLVLILLRPSEEARIGESAAAGAASLRWCLAAEGLEVEEAGEALGEGTATAAEPKSLSRFLGVSDLGFFLSDLEEAEEEAGEAAEAAPGAEVGVRGLLLPSGLEDSDDLCRDEKKRPLKTIVAPPAGSGLPSNRWGGRDGTH